MKVIFLNNELEKFIMSLEKVAIAKTLRTIELLEKFGNELGMPHSKKITKQLFELRIHGVQEVRIFYVFHKSSAVILHAFKKKTQQIPKKEIGLALQKLTILD